MADYNTEQAWDILKQFDASTPTMDYPDGTSADAFNHGTADFGTYGVGENVNDTRITNPWDPSLPENRSGYDGYKYPADKPPSPQTDQSKLVMYLAIAGVAISLLALVRR